MLIFLCVFQDNDSQHVSKSTKKWMEDVWLLDKVMTTPASSSDLNPIRECVGDTEGPSATAGEAKNKGSTGVLWNS